MDQDERQQRIAEAAYYKAEQGGFAGGEEMEDWLEAEREINRANSPLAAMDDGTPVPTQTSGNAIPAPFDKEVELRKAEAQQSAEALSKDKPGTMPSERKAFAKKG